MNQPADANYQLGVDLGTTFTAAATCSAGHIDVVDLSNRATSMPSVVFLDDDDSFLVGERAERRAHAAPARVAREFKRRLGDPTPIVLGGVPCSADLLTAELLKAAIAQTTAQRGAPPSGIALTHPAAWGPYKLDLLRQAARMADCGDVTLVSEPEAAVLHYSSTERLDPGAIVAVYDFGGGTFDAAVVCKTVDGAEVLGDPEGIEGLGGVDFDQELLRFVHEQLGPEGHQLDQTDPLVHSALLRLRDECRDAKEGLSLVDTAAVPVMLPNLQATIDITRAEFEATIASMVDDTIEVLRAALESADVGPDDLQAVLLAGGSSRIPLVQQRVAEAIGRPVALDAHPKYIVAKGAAWAAAEAAGNTGTAASAPPAPSSGTRTDAGATVLVETGSTEADPVDTGTADTGAGETPLVQLDRPRPPVPPVTDPAASVFEPDTPPAVDSAVTQETPAVAAGAEADAVARARFEPAGTATAGAGRQVPWVLIALGVLLFAGIVAGFVWLGGRGDDPQGEQAGEESDANPSGDATGDESQAGSTPVPSPEPTDEAAPTEEPSPTDPAVFVAEAVQTIAVGDGPDTPLEVGGSLFVPDSGSDTLTRVDPATGATDTIVVGSRPDTAIEAEGAIWVPARDAGTLARVEIADLSVTSISVGGNADTPAVGAGHLWLAVRDTSEMLVIDPGTNEIVQRVALAGRPLTPVVIGEELWFVTRDDNALHVVDLAGFDPGSPVTFDTIPVGADPDRPIEADGRLWVPTRDAAAVDVVDVASRQVIATLDVGDTPDTPMAAGDRIWVPNAGGTTVTVIDAQSLETVADLEVGSRPRTGAVAAGSVWIPVADASVLAQLDIETAAVVDTFITGLEPDTPMAFDGSVWVPNGASASVLELAVAEQ